MAEAGTVSFTVNTLPMKQALWTVTEYLTEGGAFWTYIDARGWPSEALMHARLADEEIDDPGYR